MKLLILFLASLLLTACSRTERISESELKEKIMVQATVLEYTALHDKKDTYAIGEGITKGLMSVIKGEANK